MSDLLARLSRKLDYQFKDIRLLECALTHRSFSGHSNYERLEFLGDSIVNFVIADALFHQFQGATEGQLSRLRARLVQGKMLAELAREFDLGEYLVMGSGELKSGGFRRDSILADVFEAVVGAIYEDADFSVCRERILVWYASRLESLSLDDTGKDAKSLLQEFLQGRKIALPVYTVTKTVGQAHDQIFTVECKVDDWGKATIGQGGSRRKAEQIAARGMLAELKKSKLSSMNGDSRSENGEGVSSNNDLNGEISNGD